SIASGFIPDAVKANRTPFDRLRTFAARKVVTPSRLFVLQTAFNFSFPYRGRRPWERRAKE
ncbi:MAG: hypothetical protein ACO1PI_12060, partial [Bacteroidota bacterium]